MPHPDDDWVPPAATVWWFCGLRNIELPAAELRLTDDFSLMKPNDLILSARSKLQLNEHEFGEAARVSAYLVLRKTQPLIQSEQRDESLVDFQNGLMALQIIKPVQTLGFTFQGCTLRVPTFSLERIICRSPMDAGAWARMRMFDADLLRNVPDMIARVFKVMRGTNTEEKNSIIFLQLALEQNHPLIAGLLCVMGMEARFDSANRDDFKKKLCNCLGASTRVFPDWNSPTFPQPKYTVEEIAIPLYVLRNKLAHGVDLRKASLDKHTPVDLMKKVELIPELETRSHALLLSEAACYLLCQVLQSCI